MTDTQFPKHHLVPARLATLNVKLVVSFLVLGLLPAIAVGVYGYRLSAGQLEEAAAARLEDAAITDGDIIDRNLFERYGDVQAFAANPLAQGSLVERQEIVDFLTANYGIYDIMLIVGLDGRVQTVNSVDGDGNSVDTTSLVGTDMSDKEWFRVVASGDTPPGGTYYTDVHRDSVVEQIYGDQRLTLPFTAPIFDRRGELIGVWHNEASFERVVGDVMRQRRQAFAAQDIASVETQVLRRDGLVVDDADPAAVFELNLVDAGLVAAVGATGDRGVSGFAIERHERTGVEQINGFAVSDGALGFDGYEWGILVRQDAREAAAPADVLRQALWLVAAVVSAIVVGAGLLLARSLSGPMKRNARTLQAVADGDLRQRFESTTRDEVGQMAVAFNSALDSIGGTLAQVNSAVGELNDSSTRLDEVSQSMSSVATHGAAQATQVAAGVEEIAVSSDSVASAMGQMDSSIREISTNTSETATLAEQAVEKSALSREQMAKLSNSATDIGDVVATITTIAEQTNLLALNATIEAARAGESGKGFAVVANEVKNLATQTANATNEIQTKVETIQADTASAVRAITEINELIKAISDASTTIAGAVEEQAVTTTTMSGSVDSVSRGTGEISERVVDMATTADTTNDGATETLAAASHLAGIADQLSELLARFQLPQTPRDRNA